MNTLKLEVKLKNTDSKFNRIFLVDGQTTFSDFTEIIFILFDWRGYNEWKFRGEIENENGELDDVVFSDQTDNDDEFLHLNASIIPMIKVLGTKCESIDFVYDSSENFTFEIKVLEKSNENLPNRRPFFLDGLMAAPPENIGSTALYLDLIKHYENPKKYSKEINIFETWYEKKYFHNDFDVKSIQNEFNNLN
ncbi:MAG: hypothetical protein EAZ27_05750 [Cytophagales bacterium]|nr:MAG: hypothetical protein EAZ27_05750 [Cytophagales bacterium]